MESSIETVFSVLIFLFILSWSLFSVYIYLNANLEYTLHSILIEYATTIKNKLIEEKKFCNASSNPIYYNITQSISIFIEVVEYELKGGIGIIEKRYCISGKPPEKFIDKAEVVGAYVNNSLIRIRVTVYGLP